MDGESTKGSAREVVPIEEGGGEARLPLQEREAPGDGVILKGILCYLCLSGGLLLMADGSALLWIPLVCAGAYLLMGFFRVREGLSLVLLEDGLYDVTVSEPGLHWRSPLDSPPLQRWTPVTGGDVVVARGRGLVVQTGLATFESGLLAAADSTGREVRVALGLDWHVANARMAALVVRDVDKAVQCVAVASLREAVSTVDVCGPDRTRMTAEDLSRDFVRVLAPHLEMLGVALDHAAVTSLVVP